MRNAIVWLFETRIPKMCMGKGRGRGKGKGVDKRHGHGLKRMGIG